MSALQELGWQETLLLGAALELGILEAVLEPPQSEEVARELGLDERATGIVLEALTALDVVKRDNGAGSYRLCEERRGPLLEPEHKEYVGAFVRDRADEISAWSQLSAVLRSGQPVQDRTASTGAAGDSVTKTFIERMRHEALPGAEATVRVLLPRLPEEAAVLDVGGGPGAIAEALVSGGAQVTVFDLPEVAALVRERLGRSGVFVEAGNMNESLLGGPFDAVYLGHTSHMYGPGETRKLFRRLYDVLAPGGMLAIRDFVRVESEGAEMFAVNMLIFTPRGRVYARDDYRRWLEEVGFEAFEIIQVPGRDTHLVLGRKPDAGAGWPSSRCSTSSSSCKLRGFCPRTLFPIWEKLVISSRAFLGSSPNSTFTVTSSLKRSTEVKRTAWTSLSSWSVRLQLAWLLIAHPTVSSSSRS